MEGLKKVSDEKFELEKRNTEQKNEEENQKYLISKFSEKISQNPIIVYVQYGSGEKPYGDSIRIDKVDGVLTDEQGKRNGVVVNFNKDITIAVSPSGIRASGFFSEKSEFYKVTNESYHNILSMMSELIEKSSYSDADKSKMLQNVINNFRNKIIKDEDVEKVEKK